MIDGGWYGQNSPSPVRMADGGWWPSYLDTPQPNPAYESTVGGYVNPLAQGVVDPVLGALQLGNRILGGPDEQDTDERIRQMRERYKQSLPGGQENRRQQMLRYLATGLVEGAFVPEVKIGQGLGRAVEQIAPRVGRQLPKVLSGATEGALYGLPLPKESPNTLQETGGQTLFSGLSGIGEQYLLPPAEQGIAALASKFGAPPHIPPIAEHEAAAEAASIAGQEANPVMHAAARHFVKRAADQLDLGNYANGIMPQQTWQPPSPPTPQTPDQESYDPLSDPLLSSGEPYARGGLYGQMRRASLRSLKHTVR